MMATREKSTCPYSCKSYCRTQTQSVSTWPSRTEQGNLQTSMDTLE